MEVKFTATSSDLLHTVPVSNGQVIALVDEAGYYYDMDHQRFQVHNTLAIDDENPTYESVYSAQKVLDIIQSLPAPMVFKGTIGHNGTIGTLPDPHKTPIGWTYKAIMDVTYKPHFRCYAAYEKCYPFNNKQKYFTATTDFVAIFYGLNSFVMLDATRGEPQADWAGSDGNFDIPSFNLDEKSVGISIHDEEFEAQYRDDTLYSAGDLGEVLMMWDTDGRQPSTVIKNGDTIVNIGEEWVVIPSGDEPMGTVTNIKILAEAPLSSSSSEAITTEGQRTITHNLSPVVPGSYCKVNVDAYGHISEGLKAYLKDIADWEYYSVEYMSNPYDIYGDDVQVDVYWRVKPEDDNIVFGIGIERERGRLYEAVSMNGELSFIPTNTDTPTVVGVAFDPEYDGHPILGYEASLPDDFYVELSPTYADISVDDLKNKNSYGTVTITEADGTSTDVPAPLLESNLTLVAGHNIVLTPTTTDDGVTITITSRVETGAPVSPQIGDMWIE